MKSGFPMVEHKTSGDVSFSDDDVGHIPRAVQMHAMVLRCQVGPGGLIRLVAPSGVDAAGEMDGSQTAN